MSSSRTPLLEQPEEIYTDSDDDLMDNNRLNELDNSNPGEAPPPGEGAEAGGGQSTAFPTYGSVQNHSDQTPPVEEKIKKKHRASSVVSLTSFGEVIFFLIKLFLNNITCFLNKKTGDIFIIYTERTR